MSGAPTLYLHIGLPKTGTTYLQEQIFPRLFWLDYLNKPLNDFLQKGFDPMYGIMDRAFNRSAVIWSELGDEVFAQVRGEAVERPPQRSLLISDEGISTGGRRPFFLRAHLKEFRRKVLEWGFASLKLILVFRRQDQWLGSHYAQVSNENPNASQQDFETFVDELLDQRKYYYIRGVLLDYKTFRDHLVEVVGQENVLMLPYELLANDPTTYLSRMLEFLGVPDDENAAQLSPELKATADEAKKNVRSLSKDTWALRDRSRKDARVIRLLPGRFFSDLGLPTAIPLRWPEFGREDSIRLTEAIKEKVFDVYAESNRALAADLGMDLEQYGYYTGLPREASSDSALLQENSVEPEEH